MNFINLWDINPNAISHLMSSLSAPLSTQPLVSVSFPCACAPMLHVRWLMLIWTSVLLFLVLVRPHSDPIDLLKLCPSKHLSLRTSDDNSNIPS